MFLNKMPKNRTGGKKGKKQSSKGVFLDSKIEHPDGAEQEIGVITKLLGNRRMMVTCFRTVKQTDDSALLSRGATAGAAAGAVGPHWPQSNVLDAEQARLLAAANDTRGGGGEDSKDSTKKERMCHVRGKLRGRVWMNVGDYVLISLHTDLDDEKGDIIHKYPQHQISGLKKDGMIPSNTEINEGSGTSEYTNNDDIFEFVEMDSDEECKDMKQPSREMPPSSSEEESEDDFNVDEI